MTITFKKAEKKQAKLRLAYTGPAGSGKTLSSLCTARGIVGPDGRIAVIDTERDSASLYADLYEFDTVNLTPPYTTEKYIEAIHAAEEAGYDIVIIDSISHAWAGAGGLLDQQDAIASSKGSDKFRSWGQITPKHQAFVDAMLACKIHLIATMRSKTEYALVATETGKTKPEKLGLAPVQRDGMDYEFTTVLDIDTAHTCQASKDRTGLFANRVFVPDESIGQALREWLDSGRKPDAPVINPVTQAPPIPAVIEKKPLGKPPQKTPRPKNVATKGEADEIRKRYQEEGFSEAIFDTARWTDGVDELWDKDVIMSDWKQRYNLKKEQEAKKQQPVVKKTGLVSETLCESCGKKVLVKEAETSKQRFGTVLCPDCYKAELAAVATAKQTKPTEEKPGYVCSICGAAVTKGRKDACEFMGDPVTCRNCGPENKKGGDAA